MFDNSAVRFDNGAGISPCVSNDLFIWYMLLPQPSLCPDSESFHEGEVQSHISECTLARGFICSLGLAKLTSLNSYAASEPRRAGTGKV